MMKHYLSWWTAAVVVSCLTGCGGGGSSSDSGTSSSAGSGSSSGTAAATTCNYPDKFTASERQQANACGIQVSANFAQADSGLAQVIAACQMGKKAEADAYYSGTYSQMVNYARQVAASLSCGTGTGISLPDQSKATYYNFCVLSTTSGGVTRYTGSCSGPFKYDESSCPSGSGTAKYVFIKQYSDANACKAGRDAWLANR